MTPDPSGLYYADLANPQSLNLYSYAQNNPLKNIDPTGLDCVYLNDAGDGVDQNGIDHNSSQGECNGSGGYWAPGNVSGASSVQTFSNSDLIAVASTTNGQNVTSVANCAGCSTQNPDGTLLGAFTQTIGNQSPSDMSFLFSNLAQNPLPRPMDQVGRQFPLMTQGQINLLCESAAAMNLGGTNPGGIVQQDTSNDTRENMQVNHGNNEGSVDPIREIRGRETIAINGFSGKGDAAAGALLIPGVTGACQQAAGARNR